MSFQLTGHQPWSAGYGDENGDERLIPIEIREGGDNMEPECLGGQGRWHLTLLLE